MLPLHASIRLFTASVALVLLAAACRTSDVPHAALSGCHPACPGAREAGIADAGELLRGDPPPMAAPPEGAEPERAPSGAAYLCPMHPWIGADEPARCPECNMKLVPRGDVLEHDHGG